MIDACIASFRFNVTLLKVHSKGWERERWDGRKETPPGGPKSLSSLLFFSFFFFFIGFPKKKLLWVFFHYLNEKKYKNTSADIDVIESGSFNNTLYPGQWTPF